MNPTTFLEYLDEPTRTMVIAKLKAMGYRPERLMSSGDSFFKALERALGRDEYERLMKMAESIDATVRRLLQALDDPNRFITTAGEVPDEVVERLDGNGTFRANRGLGCPDDLAKASALAKALFKYAPKEREKLAALAEKLWELATEQCSVLNALARQTYEVEEY
ncbi:MAG: hypothetical protein QW317_11665 [Thermoproteus sp.]